MSVRFVFPLSKHRNSSYLSPTLSCRIFYFTYFIETVMAEVKNPANTLNYDEVSAKILASLTTNDSYEKCHTLFSEGLKIIWDTNVCVISQFFLLLTVADC